MDVIEILAKEKISLNKNIKYLIRGYSFFDLAYNVRPTEICKVVIFKLKVYLKISKLEKKFLKSLISV